MVRWIRHRWIQGIGLTLGLYLALLGLLLLLRAAAPIDGVLVLGGSIDREIYAIAHASALPAPILISGGSPQDCIQKIFDRYPANPNNIWLEPCAHSTFENFAFAAPFLQAQQVKHVLVITSGNHLFRARTLGKIMLGFRGIAVDGLGVSDKGRPGNAESTLKTLLDLLRGTLWGLVSPILPAKHCPGIVSMGQVPSGTALPASKCETHPALKQPGS